MKKKTIESRVYKYIVKHGGEIDLEECAMKLGLSKREVKGSIESLKGKGKLEEVASEELIRPPLLKIRKEQIEESQLVAQPGDWKPFLSDKIIRGIYDETDVNPKVYFSNIGKTAWETALDLDSNAKICVSDIQDSRSWEILINISGLQINLLSLRYKGVLNSPKNFYIQLGLRGKISKIHRFIRKLIETIPYRPWELDDWGRFSCSRMAENSIETRIKAPYLRETEIEKWLRFIEFKTPRLCPECASVLEADEKFCVQCGAEIQDK